MVETLILGMLLGGIVVAAGAAYSAHKFLKDPFMVKTLSDGYTAIAIDKSFKNEECSYIALKKNDDIIAAVKFNEKGITDISYDIQI